MIDIFTAHLIALLRTQNLAILWIFEFMYCNQVTLRLASTKFSRKIENTKIVKSSTR